MPTLFMEKTEISDTKTAMEIQDLLARKGASRIQVDYAAGGRPDGLSFCFRVHDQDIPFRLPCRWQKVERILRQTRKSPRRRDTWDGWARRVAWRQVLRWVEAQLAMIETGMTSTEEVFLPYAIMSSQKTVYEMFSAQGFKAIPDQSAQETDSDIPDN